MLTGSDLNAMTEEQRGDRFRELAAAMYGTERYSTACAADLGVTPDEVKATPQWRADFNAYHAAAGQLRAFNRDFVRVFKRELAAERNAKRAL